MARKFCAVCVYVNNSFTHKQPFHHLSDVRVGNGGSGIYGGATPPQTQKVGSPQFETGAVAFRAARYHVRPRLLRPALSSSKPTMQSLKACPAVRETMNATCLGIPTDKRGIAFHTGEEGQSSDDARPVSVQHRARWFS